MNHTANQLLRPAGRGYEIALGLTTLLLGTTFGALFVWLTYLVAWRNPSQFGIHDLFKLSTVFILTTILLIAVFFLRVAWRLLNAKRRDMGLLSPLFLRIWAVFFATGSCAVLFTAAFTDVWYRAFQAWTTFLSSVTMAVASFLLARRRERLVDGKIGQPSSGRDA